MQSYLQYRSIGLAVEKQVSQARIWTNNESQQVQVSGRVGTESENDHETAHGGTFPPAFPPATFNNDSSCHCADKSFSPNQRWKPKENINLPGVSIHSSPASNDEKSSLIFLVEWAIEDGKLNPRKFDIWKRAGLTLVVSALAFVVGIAASIDTAIMPQASQDLHVSEEVESIASGKVNMLFMYRSFVYVAKVNSGIYLLGFALGSLFCGPLSEVFGRNAVYIGSLTLFSIFIMASALAPNIGAQLSFRFLAGLFGCPPLTCSGGTVADVWTPLEKSISYPLYSLGAFGGPLLGPVVAAYIGPSSLSWRWTEWLTLVMAGFMMIIVLLFMPETYTPILLTWKARHLRRILNDSRYRSILEVENTGIFRRMLIGFKRQRQLITREPVVLFIALYLSIVWTVLFTFFDGYTYIFEDTYHISQGLTNIIWVAMYVGIILGEIMIFPVYYSLKRDLRDLDKGEKIRPEARLLYAMFCAPAIPVSLFWMAWTSYVSLHV